MDILVKAMVKVAAANGKTKPEPPNNENLHNRITSLLDQTNDAFRTDPGLNTFTKNSSTHIRRIRNSINANFDPFGIDTVAVRDLKLEWIDSALLYKFADAGHLILEFGRLHGTPGIRVGFPTPNTFIALRHQSPVQKR